LKNRKQSNNLKIKKMAIEKVTQKNWFISPKVPANVRADKINEIIEYVNQGEIEIAAIETTIDNIIAGVELAADGTFSLPAGTYYLAGATSILDTIDILDEIIYNNSRYTGFGTFGYVYIENVGLGQVVIYSRIVGEDGNDWEISLVDTGGTAGTIVLDPLAKVMSVEIVDGVTTAAQLTAYINEHYLANKYFYSEEVDGGAMAVTANPVVTIGGSFADLYPDDLGSAFISYTSLTDLDRTPTIYNGLQVLDAGVNIINERDNHLSKGEHIIKHPLMAVVDYDFAVNGGAISSINISGVDVIPNNAIILNVTADVLVAPTSATNDGTIKLKCVAGDVTTNITADGTAVPIGYPNWAGPFVKTGAAGPLSVEIGTANLTAGKIKYYVWYVVSE
jgi:hypothetical protein